MHTYIRVCVCIRTRIDGFVCLEGAMEGAGQSQIKEDTTTPVNERDRK